MLENEVGRGRVNAEAVAGGLWRRNREPGPQWTAQEPPRILATSPVGLAQNRSLLIQSTLAYVYTLGFSPQIQRNCYPCFMCLFPCF